MTARAGGDAFRKAAMFVVLSLVYMVSFAQAVVMTVVANDVMRDLGLTASGMGRLGSFYLYGYSGVMLFSGMLTAWLGPRKTLSTLCLVSGIGGLLFSTSDIFAVSALGRMLSGIGLSSNMTSAFTVFTRWYPADRYSRLCSIFVALGGLGTLTANALLPTLNAWWGWRSLFYGLALLTLVYSVLVYVTVRDWPPAANSPESPASEAEKRAATTPKALVRGFATVAKRLDFWRIFLWFFCLAGVFFSFSGLWAMPYLKEIYGMSHGEAGVIASVVSFGYIFGAPFVSWLADSKLHSYRACMGTSGLLIVAASAFLILRIDAMSSVTIFLLVFVIGMNVNGPTAIAHAAARNLFGSGMAGVVSGIFGCSAFLGGAFLQIVCGELLDLAGGMGWPPAAGYALAFSPYCLCGAVAAWAGYTISRNSFPEKAVESREAGS